MSAAAAPQPDNSAAHQLVGLGLADGWSVVEKIQKAPDATGSHFSVGYIVERDGQRAFLKALDFSYVLQLPDFTRAMQGATEEFNFERDILETCRVHRMDRVVLALGHGNLMIQGAPIPQVSYLIFEKADGDIRYALDAEREVPASWKLRMLHNAATGLWQMHGRLMAHQDVKPSNVLIFSGNTAKVADLGRASQAGVAAPHDNLDFPGDPAHQPLEFFYSQISSEWNERRQASDLFMLGSLMLFLFGGTSVVAAVKTKLPDPVQPENWQGRSYAEALPYIRVAFNEAIDELTPQLRADLSDDACERVVRMIRQLSDPDPSLRGHPNTRAMRHANPYSLERFIAELDLLAQRAGAAGL